MESFLRRSRWNSRVETNLIEDPNSFKNTIDNANGLRVLLVYLQGKVLSSNKFNANTPFPYMFYELPLKNANAKLRTLSLHVLQILEHCFNPMKELTWVHLYYRRVVKLYLSPKTKNKFKMQHFQNEIKAQKLQTTLWLTTRTKE